MSNTTKFKDHPLYTERAKLWTECRDLYDGKRDVVVDEPYLVMHEFEQQPVKNGDKLWKIRRQRTEYTNIIKPFTRRFAAMMLKDKLETDKADSVLTDETKVDVDGDGTKLSKFIRSVAENYLLYGRAIVLADSFAQRGVSRGDEQRKGLRPYLELINPLEMRDWDIEKSDPARLGKFNFIRLQYTAIEPRLDPTKAAVLRWYCRVLSRVGGVYTITDYIGPKANGKVNVQNVDWKLEGAPQIVQELTELPISWIDTDAWMAAVCPIAKKRLNLESSLDNQLNFQAHQRVIVGGDFEGDEIVMGEGTVTLVPKGTTVEVVSPSNPEALFKRILQATASAYQVAFNQARTLPQDSKAVQGADTLREDKEDFLETVKDMIGDIEQVLNGAIRNLGRFMSKKDSELSKLEIKLGTDITIEDVDQEVALIQAADDRINRYPKWRKAVDLRLASHMGLENMDEVIEEIENNDPIDTDQQQRGNLLRQVINGDSRADSASNQAGNSRARTRR